MRSTFGLAAVVALACVVVTLSSSAEAQTPNSKAAISAIIPMAAPAKGQVKALSYMAYQFDPPTWEMLDNLLFEDSHGWAVNVYISGSLHNVTLLSGSYTSGNWSAIGEYSFSNRILRGRYPGWVKFHFQRGRVYCLEYHDNQGQCR